MGILKVTLGTMCKMAEGREWMQNSQGRRLLQVSRQPGMTAWLRAQKMDASGETAGGPKSEVRGLVMDWRVMWLSRKKCQGGTSTQVGTRFLAIAHFSEMGNRGRMLHPRKWVGGSSHSNVERTLPRPQPKGPTLRGEKG